MLRFVFGVLLYGVFVMVGDFLDLIEEKKVVVVLEEIVGVIMVWVWEDFMVVWNWV